MDEKQKKILIESAKLFQKYGIRSISMDDISREMGISKKTMYQYFENKADLISKILNYNFELHSQVEDAHILEKGNAIDILLTVSKKVCEELKEFNPSITFDLQKFYPEIYKQFFEKKRDHIFEKIKCNIKKGIEQDIFRNDLDIELVARLYVQRLADFHNPDFILSGEGSFEKVFKAMFDNHIRGISNAKGIEYYEKQKNNLNFNL
ncbi:MAG: TetR/AcrR family transcriptional regulator [Lentimicrobiaceae bacterium]|nr:TetR/AcrR family transcriptional regulator [Lentimicrobiaceae bacterium]